MNFKKKVRIIHPISSTEMDLESAPLLETPRDNKKILFWGSVFFNMVLAVLVIILAMHPLCPKNQPGDHPTVTGSVPASIRVERDVENGTMAVVFQTELPGVSFVMVNFTHPEMTHPGARCAHFRLCAPFFPGPDCLYTEICQVMTPMMSDHKKLIEAAGFDTQPPW